MADLHYIVEANAQEGDIGGPFAELLVVESEDAAISEGRKFMRSILRPRGTPMKFRLLGPIDMATLPVAHEGED